jgi:hypothetical protein
LRKWREVCESNVCVSFSPARAFSTRDVLLRPAPRGLESVPHPDTSPPPARCFDSQNTKIVDVHYNHAHYLPPAPTINRGSTPSGGARGVTDLRSVPTPPKDKK